MFLKSWLVVVCRGYNNLEMLGLVKTVDIPA